MGLLPIDGVSSVAGMGSDGEPHGNDEASSLKKDERIRLRIIQLNDVYKLDNFPNFKTLVDHYSNENGKDSADKTIVVLAGDFLGPSLLSSLDRGRGFVDVMGACGLTHVCFGNHETDIPMEALPERITESSFVWLNSNMRELDEKIGVTTPEYDVIQVSKCRNGDNTREHTKTVALLGLLTEDPSLYRKGAFADATIEPVAKATERMLNKLRTDIDLVVPLTHQSMPRDREFASIFTGSLFPVVIGGHDHEVYDEVHNHCRIVKTGMDAVNAAIIDIDWPLCYTTDHIAHPTVCVKMVPTQSFQPDPGIAHRVDGHQVIVRELEMAKLFRIECDTDSDPFTTVKNRIRPTNGSKILTTAIRMGMRAECAILNAGFIRGGKEYDSAWFTWSDLKAEMPFPTEITTVELPGQVLSDVITYSRRGAFESTPVESGGYFQTCDMIEFNDETRCIESIRGEPFDPDRSYLTALPTGTLRGMDNNAPLLEWSSEHCIEVHKKAGFPAKLAIVELFSALLWLELGSFADIDENKDGVISPAELKKHAQNVFGREFADLVVANVMAVADIDGDGCIKPSEMVTTQFIATDMMSHVCTSEELGVMTRLASEMLDLPASHPDVLDLVRMLQQRVDKKKNGRMTREEAIEVLGKVKSKEILT